MLLKECIAELTPMIISTINASINESHVPTSFKKAHIKPLLWCNALIRKFLKITGQFRTLRQVILEQLEKHLAANELKDALKYVYHAKHSTETTLLKVQNNVL